MPTVLTASGINRALRFLLLAFGLCAAVPAVAADRVALVIGNNAYRAAPLRNSVNDARDLGQALGELGFEVIQKEDVSRSQFIDSVRQFGSKLKGARVALFFFSGHAVQFKDRNYLVPVDANLASEDDITFFGVEVSQIFDQIDRARTGFNFIILDASRSSPFGPSFKISSPGLAQMSSPPGTLIAYATSPGSFAADGFGRNGIYTKHILQNIKVPDVPVEILFKRVREAVERETRKQQTPWDSSSLKGDFAFNSSGRPTAAVGAAPATGSPSADTTLAIEREFWVSVRDSNRPDDIRAYLDKYPTGDFASLARNRLEALSRAQAPPASGAASPAVASPSGISEDRKALVIGNDDYQHVGRLANARADAQAIAKALESAGFAVTVRQNLPERAMKEALRNFKSTLKGGDVAVFFYSGHGVQLGAANYLLPVDIRGDGEEQIRDDSIPLQRVLDDFQDQKTRFSLAIIDACRNNPFRQGGRSLGGRGLAPTTAATGQMVLYSAGAGQQALDSLGPADRNPNGVFTRVFVKEMNKPGVSVDRVLRSVREEVARLARSVNHSQVPAIYDQALGDFYFHQSGRSP